jgi:putative hemolysin
MNAYIIRALMFILKPVTWLIVGLVNLLTRGLKGEDEDEEDGDAVEELQSIIDTAEDEAVLDEDQTELVKAAIDFSDVSASEVMTARVDMVALDVGDDWDEILKTIDASPIFPSAGVRGQHRQHHRRIVSQSFSQGSGG